ncbi:DEAD/DEAH box helicase [bacterium]|nr:DEAD/DEAH box helicase [bacterium]
MTDNESKELAPAQLEDLPEDIRNAVVRAGWKGLMPVQERAIPYMLERRDLMVQSRTGSGKTGAFVLPILHQIDSTSKSCQALILVPTRELALQVSTEATKLSGDSGVRVVAVYGGVAYGPQIDGFKAGAHIVVGTPGRVLDHLLKGALSLNGLDFLIFDEADRMLSMGFYPDMKKVQRYLPDRALCSTMFSATFPPSVVRLAHDFLYEPETLSLSADHVHVTDTTHVYHVVGAMDKDRALVRVIEIENPDSAIIFCNRKDEVHYVATVLKRFGYDAEELSADLSQNARERVLGRLRAGSLRFLVATDVAARGIDIPELSHVIQYSPPEDPEAYIHRAGRTGRAGATGEAITFAAGLEKAELGKIARRFKIDMEERELPTDEDVERVVSERLTALLEAKRRDRDKLRVERMQRFMRLAKELAENDDERELLAMLLDDMYQDSLHAPPAGAVAVPEESPAKSQSGDKGGAKPRKRRKRPPRN